MKKLSNLILLIIIIGVIGLFCYIFIFSESKKEKATRELFENTNKDYAEINKYIVYGTHLNIEGEIDKKLYEDNIISASLIFKTIDGKEETIDIEYEL